MSNRIDEIEEIVFTHRFSTAEAAASWGQQVLQKPHLGYVRVSNPYFENVIKYAPFAIDCTRQILKKHNK